MKTFDKIQEGAWQEFCQDWIERRDQKKDDRDANYHIYFGRNGHGDEHYQMINHVVRVRAKNIFDNSLFELHILTATRKDRDGLYPIICLIDNNGLKNLILTVIQNLVNIFSIIHLYILNLVIMLLPI